MALKVNCDGFQRENYFARSWALITQDKGWIKPILLLTFAQFIPILGPLGASGYGVEWARLIAWNVNAAPKQHSVNIGECIVSGWRTFVVYLGWSLIGCLAVLMLGMVPLLGALLTFAATIIWLYFEQLIRVGTLRASIYQQIGAGYKASRIWEMGERDVEGLLRIIAIGIIGGIILGLIMTIVFSLVLIAMAPSLVSFVQDASSAFYYGTDEEIIAFFVGLFDVISAFMPALLFASLISSFFTTLINMIQMGALGLWMRQFNVPAWGRSEDPLPEPMPETYGWADYTTYAMPDQMYGNAPQQYATQQYTPQQYATQPNPAPQPAPQQYAPQQEPITESIPVAEEAVAEPLSETPELEPVPEIAQMEVHGSPDSTEWTHTE